MKIHFVVEGELEYFVARKILLFCGHQIGTPYKKQGSGNIQKQAYIYANLVQGDVGVLVLTDFMDTKCPCATQALKVYRHEKRMPSNFIIRFAVPELESWLLADRANFSNLLGVSPAKLPAQPDTLSDPKKTIGQLARLSRKKDIKEDLVTSSGRQGRRYIPLMQRFVEKEWDIEAAMKASSSLARCIARLREIKPA